MELMRVRPGSTYVDGQ